MDRNFALELVRVTEAAALGAAKGMGRGDEVAAESAGVLGMVKAFGSVAVKARIVIGRGRTLEGESLEPGRTVGSGEGPRVDLAVDPLEGTNPCASGRYNALACIAAAEEGGLLAVPEVYMEKIAVGPAARGAVALDKTPTENLRAVAQALGRNVDQLTVAILDRPRHKDLIEEVRAAGARIRHMLDGD
ncbi:MAG: fructose-bisphosphatase class II, partial [Candidatus Methylomirabilis sp.]|nr:fructose-bisphosphatase class II [Deltaproteobacteria bacterium]